MSCFDFSREGFLLRKNKNVFACTTTNLYGMAVVGVVALALLTSFAIIQIFRKKTLKFSATARTSVSSPPHRNTA
ncbi:unnamed protein product [Amoebophrya sp. A120]|nr:unnamed protein product [Amoebophrya sp. A120]|eukprot:GSA120T00019615001.1